MKSWVYLFSEFSSEALLVEAAVICILTASYTAYWIRRKRREGAVGDEVPSNVVKVYLAELIAEAEEMQNQLFGLLSRSGVSAAALGAGARLRVQNLNVAPPPVVSDGDTPAAPDPELIARLTEMEAKLAEQNHAMELVMGEKEKIERDLAAAKAAGAEAAAATPQSDDEQMKELQEKIDGLEEKLAEYSVIEDDLANLKRLQQENSQLKAQIEGGGGTVPDMTAAPEPEAEPAADSEPVAEAAAETPAEVPAEEPAAASQEAATPVAEADTAAAAGETDPGFEQLVDQVEESIAQPDAAAAPTEAAEESESASTSASGADNMGKSDEDLLSEFEKMLNS